MFGSYQSENKHCQHTLGKWVPCMYMAGTQCTVGLCVYCVCLHDHSNISPLWEALHCTISPNTITFTYCSAHMLGRYYSHLSLSKVFASTNRPPVGLLLITDNTNFTGDTSQKQMLSVNEWPTTWKWATMKYKLWSLQSRLVENISENRFDWICKQWIRWMCVRVSGTQGYHNDGVNRGLVTLIRQYPEDKAKRWIWWSFTHWTVMSPCQWSE